MSLRCCPHCSTCRQVDRLFWRQKARAADDQCAGDIRATRDDGHVTISTKSPPERKPPTTPLILLTTVVLGPFKPLARCTISAVIYGGSASCGCRHHETHSSCFGCAIDLGLLNGCIETCHPYTIISITLLLIVCEGETRYSPPISRSGQGASES
jgi:hypothetical protein